VARTRCHGPPMQRCQIPGSNGGAHGRLAKRAWYSNNTLRGKSWEATSRWAEQACTANFSVFVFYRLAGRPRRTSLPLECQATHAPLPAPLLLATHLSHNIPFPRVQ
jgi:hypothetical protein